MLIRFPPQLSDWQEKYLRIAAQEWCLANGLVLARADDEGGQAAPITLFPSPFSKNGFEEALSVQQAFNTLYHSIVSHPNWLLGELERLVAPFDDFTQRLISCHRAASRRRTQRLTGGLFRSDYIVDRIRTNDEGRQIKQVEFNTISVSFGALSSKVTQLHHFLASSGRSAVYGEIPKSRALTELAEGLAHMHRAYNIAESRPSGTGAILMIVQPGELNRIDQRLLEYELFKVHGILVFRCTLEQVGRQTAVDDQRNRLSFLPTGHEITVVYYRAGYSPNDYPTSTEWAARLMLEGSHAIQCPSVLTQLAGSKKVQELLTRPGVIENDLNTPLAPLVVEQIRKTFVKIYSLDASTPEGREGIRLALESPQEYVLKPQREGGGNNIYRDDIPGFLRSVPEETWGAYILMELIEPPRVSNKILRGSEVVSGRVVNELGVFGCVLWDIESGEEVMNTQAGYLLRTKLQGNDEGGIAAGYGCLDAVLLPSKR